MRILSSTITVRTLLPLQFHQLPEYLLYHLLSTAYTPTRIMGILAGDEEQTGVTQDSATAADTAAQTDTQTTDAGTDTADTQSADGTADTQAADGTAGEGESGQ